MNPKATVWNLWPTRVMALHFDDAAFDERLVRLVLDRHRSAPPETDDELRVYEFFGIDDPDVKILGNRVREAVQAYLGPESTEWYTGLDLDGRAVIVPDRAFIQTHVERREADLTVAYFPTGDAVNKPLSWPGNPRFVVEDPSRALTDLRLPFEERHSVHLAPRPGLMLVFPSHVPHHQQPYRGETPHIQIVCNVKIRFKPEYFRAKW